MSVLRPVRLLVVVCTLAALSPALEAVDYPTTRVLTHREQAPLVRRWIEQRFDTVLPQLMRRTGIDMWIIVSREYNDDPVFRSMAPLTTFSSRRRTILVFVDRGGDKGVERLSIGRFDYDKLFTVVPTGNDAQYEGLRALVDERQPRVIGINESEHSNHADGITATEKRLLVNALGPANAAKIKSAEALAIGWLEVKIDAELEAYRHVMTVAHRVIGEAFSNQVITPGTTTTEDVAWWMRQRVAEMGLGKWFHPSVSIQRRGGVVAGDGVIRRGDLLHTDFGIVYLGFSTDTQHHAYVLKDGESEAPQGLRDGLKAANRLQDLTIQFVQVGRTGNQVLKDVRTQAIAEGIEPSIYCHPVGYHGHAAGPPIGMTDYQDGVPVRGDDTFRPNTWHSVELNAQVPVAEWGGQKVRFALEEDAAILADGRRDWILRRQEALYLIR